MAKNGVKTLRKLKAVKFEDLIFGNSTPQGVKIFLRQAFEAIEEEKGNVTLWLPWPIGLLDTCRQEDSSS